MRKFIKQKENTTIVKLIDKTGKVFIGKAKVHPDDMDMGNTETGAIIAESRARIKRHEFKVKDYNNKIDKLYKEIKILEEARDYHVEEADLRKEFLKYYINKKEAFYRQVRKLRLNPRGIDDIVNSIASKLNELDTDNKGE